MVENNKYFKELREVKDKLVNTSLVVAFFAGIPLLTVSIIRSIVYEEIDFVLINSLAFLSLLLITLFRNKIQYSLKANYVLVLLMVLALTDLLEVGFLSMGYIWLTLASILAFLYFELMYSIIVTLIAIAITILIKVLTKYDIIEFSIDFNDYAQSDIVMLIRLMSFVIVSFIVVFSVRRLTMKFDNYIEKLAIQRQNLMSSAIRMRREIEYRKLSENAAKASESKFKNIFESSSDPMAIMSIDGRFLDYNLSFLKLSEVSSEKLKKLHFIDIVPPDYKEFFERMGNDIKNIPTRFDLNYISQTSGKLVYLDVTTSHVDYEGNDALLTIFRDNTEKRNQERIMYSAALEAEERERLRMSKELHDGLGPLLSTLKIYFEALEHRPNDLEIQKRIKNILNDSINSVKEISNNLSPYVLQNLGIIKALRAFVDKIVYSGKLDIQFVSDVEQRFDEKIEITVYRLVTEMLNNTIQHAEANKVFISIDLDDKMLKILYIDDGRGFEPSKVNKKTSGIGLFNMKSRIENMGGKCDIRSAKDEGFKLAAEIDIMRAVL